MLSLIESPIGASSQPSEHPRFRCGGVRLVGGGRPWPELGLLRRPTPTMRIPGLWLWEAAYRMGPATAGQR